jgi:methanogenic corrinoid protein MtbC1
VAGLPTDELRQLVKEDEFAQSQAPASPSVVGAQLSNGTFEACIRAIERLDPEGLNAVLERASVAMSKPALVEQVIAPLLERIGENWRDGSLRVASEHLASASLRTFLGNINGAFPVMSDAPRLLVTTPAGQLHELGALIAGTAAAAEGWQITYLGPSLPAEEIAAAAETNGSRAVALSIVLADDSHVKNELAKLGQLLHENIALLVGGRASAHYADVLQQIGAVRLPDMPSFRTELETLRSEPRPRSVS